MIRFGRIGSQFHVGKNDPDKIKRAGVFIDQDGVFPLPANRSAVPRLFQQRPESTNG